MTTTQVTTTDDTSIVTHADRNQEGMIGESLRYRLYWKEDRYAYAVNIVPVERSNRDYIHAEFAAEKGSAAAYQQALGFVNLYVGLADYGVALIG